MIPFLSLTLLGASWLYSVYVYGGMVPESWRWSMAGIGAAGVLLWLFPQDQTEGRWRRVDIVVLLVVLALALLQWLPVPLAVVGWISPQRLQ